MADILTSPAVAAPAAEPPRLARLAAAALWPLATLLAVLMMLAPVTDVTVGVIGVGLLLTLLLTGIPVAIAMILAGAVGIVSLRGFDIAWTTFYNVPYDSVASWSLSVLPMFILMGLLLWRSGATNEMYTASRSLLSWLPGSLAVTTNAAGGILGAASGSTLGIAYALGRIALPEMLSAGYSKRVALASVLMAGSGGQLIPPSVLLVIYAGVAGTSVGDQLLTGVVPGAVLVLLYGAVIIGFSLRKGEIAKKQGEAASDDASPAVTPVPAGLPLRTLLRALPFPVLIISVVGGIYFGWFTATEAGAFGVGVAVLISFLFLRGKAPKEIYTATTESVTSVAAVFLLVIGAAVFARFMAMSGLTRDLVQLVSDMSLSRVGFLVVLTLAFLVMGMFLDPLAMILLAVPVLLPVLELYDVSPLWFGVFMVFMGEMAIVTPPVGILLYVVHGLAQEPDVNVGHTISLRDVMGATLLFVPAALGVLLFLIFLPGAATVLVGN